MLIAVEPHHSRRAAAPPFAQHGPVAEQDRRDVDEVEAVDVAGRVGAREEGHFKRLEDRAWCR